MVKLKRKVTLRTKVADTSDSTKLKYNKWLLWVGVVFVAIVAFLFLKPNNSDNSAVTEQNEILVSISDSLDNKAENESEKVVGNQSNGSLTETTQNNSFESKKEDTKKASSLSIEYIEEKALLVIRGNYGNGEERKMKLGAEYQTIQDKVNEMYRKGLVH